MKLPSCHARVSYIEILKGTLLLCVTPPPCPIFPPYTRGKWRMLYYIEPSFIFNDRFDHVRIIYRFVVTTSVVGRYVGNDARHEQFFEILFERNWKSRVRMVNERIFRFFSFLFVSGQSRGERLRICGANLIKFSRYNRSG